MIIGSKLKGRRAYSIYQNLVLLENDMPTNELFIKTINFIY